MKEEPNEDLLKKLVEAEPQVIKTTPSDISISVTDKAGNPEEYFYEKTISSSAMVSTTAANLGIELTPTCEQRFIGAIEEVKEYHGEVEVDVSPLKIPLGKIKVKGGVLKKYKRYMEIKEKIIKNSIKNGGS